MTRIEQWNTNRRARLIAALLLNAVFLAATVLIVRVGFESNDDLTLAAFVDGQMAARTAYIPYVNFVLGLLMKGVYTLLGQGVAWHTLGQYLLLFVSFTALNMVLNERLGIVYGCAVSTVLLLFFGADVYTVISYTKTAAVCTVGGMVLLVHTMEQNERRWGAVVLGAALCVFGFMLRRMEFLPCFGLMAALCLRRLCGLLFLEKGTGREKGRALYRFALPFVCVAALCAMLYLVDWAAWSRAPWSAYREYDAIRVDYSDYGRPTYGEMPEEYAYLGLSEADVELLYEGNYFDTEQFSGAVMQSITNARDLRFSPPSLGECLGLFLDRCLPGFFINLPVYGLLLLLALWLFGGAHAPRDWLALLAVAGLFAAAYLYLIWRGRYLIDRVDAGLFLAGAVCAAYMLSREKLSREPVMTVLTLLLAVGISWYLVRDDYRANDPWDSSDARAAVERLLEDGEHVYLAKLDTVSDRIYSPFEPAGKGYWDRIVLLGGFDCNHPAIMNNLRQYGVENPYRDCVGNERVYLIEDDIELTLAFIHEHYDPDAAAELVQPLSDETGLMIYRIRK